MEQAGGTRNLTVGLIGLGHQGSILANAMLARGVRLFVFDRKAEAIARLAVQGAIAADGPISLAARADILMVCVVDDRQVEELALGPDGVLAAMKRGATLIVHSTTSPALIGRLLSDASPRGVDVVDAPVSGGADPATPLSYMVGGAPEAVERCLPYLGAGDGQVILTGGPATGMMTKLAHQIVLCGALLAVEEGRRFAASLDLDLDRVAAALRAGVAGSRLTDRIAATVVRPGTEHLLLKDLELCRSLLDDGDLAFPGITAAMSMLTARAGAA